MFNMQQQQTYINNCNNKNINGDGGGLQNSELINQANLLNKLNQQLANTFSNKSSNNIKHQKYFNDEEYEEIIHQDNVGMTSTSQNNQGNNTQIRNNSQKQLNQTNITNKNSKSKINGGGQIKLFSTNLQSFGNLPLYSQSSQSNSMQSLHYEQQLYNQKQKPPISINKNQSVKNKQNNLVKNDNLNMNNINFLSDNINNINNPLEMSPLFSQKSTNLSVHSQNNINNKNFSQVFGGMGNNNKINDNNNLSQINDSSIMQIQNEYVYNLVSMQIKGMVRQLYYQLSLYPDDEQNRLNLQQDKDKLIKSLRNSMEGLLKVLIWQLDGVITQNEFSQIFLEWQRKRNIDNCLLNTSSITEQGIDEQQYLWDLLQKYFKDHQQIIIQIPKIIQLFQTEFKSQLQQNSITLGIDNVGKQINNVSQQWIDEVESLYKILDDENRGSIDCDRIQFFLMGLLLNEIKSHNREDMIVLVQKQTSAIMEHMFHTFGYINIRNFKQYLLIQRLRRPEEIVTLKNNLKRIQKYWFKAKRANDYTRQPVMRLFLTKFPQTLIQSIVNALNDKQFEIFLLEMNSTGFYQFDCLTQIAHPNNQQLLKIVQFYVDQFYEIGVKHGFLDGTLVIQETLEQFADILFKKLINVCKSELSMVIHNISTFKNTFVNAIQQYSTLNNQAITDIIDQHLLLETEGSNNTTLQNETQVVNNTKETNIVDSYQTQTSPPRKPNLSPITSTSRLAQEGSQQNLFEYNQVLVQQTNPQFVNLPPKHNTRQSLISNNLDTSNLSTTPKIVQNNKSQFHTTSQSKNQNQNNNVITSKQRQSSLTNNNNNNEKDSYNNSSNLPSFTLNLFQLSKQQQNQNQELTSQKQTQSKQNVSNLMITKHNTNKQKQIQKQQQKYQSPINHTSNINSNEYNDNGIYQQNGIQNDNGYSQNTSRTSSQNIPYASATAALQQSFNSQFSMDDNVNYQQTVSTTNNQNIYTSKDYIQQQQQLNTNITPVKISLRQQIEQQQQVLSSMNKSPHNNMKLYQYSSQKNKARDRGQSFNGIVQQQQRQQQQYPNVIVQTPLSAVPHIQTDTKRNSRSSSNNKLIVTSQNVQQNRYSLNNGNRTPGSVSNRQQNLKQNSSQVPPNIPRRSGQQPQQINTQRAKTPIIQINQHQHSKSYQPQIISVNQKDDNNQYQQHTSQHQHSNSHIIDQYQNNYVITSNTSKQVQPNKLITNYIKSHTNTNILQTNPIIIINSNSNTTLKSNSKSSLSQNNNNQNVVRSSLSSNSQQQLGSASDKSPIRSRRVENYEDVISRLMSLSVTNTKKM